MQEKHNLDPSARRSVDPRTTTNSPCFGHVWFSFYIFWCEQCSNISIARENSLSQINSPVNVLHMATTGNEIAVFSVPNRTGIHTPSCSATAANTTKSNLTVNHFLKVCSKNGETQILRPPPSHRCQCHRRRNLNFIFAVGCGGGVVTIVQMGPTLPRKVLAKNRANPIRNPVLLAAPRSLQLLGESEFLAAVPHQYGALGGAR